jgi:hypothetical protein
MDVGIFKNSGVRLKLWLILPPLLMISLGLGTRAWRERAKWQLEQTQALSEILPPLISARRDVVGLFKGFSTSSGGELDSEDQLISFLQDMAQQNEFMLDTVNRIEQKKQKRALPVMNAVVRGRGDFTAVQMYINEAKSGQQLLSVDAINIQQPPDTVGEGIFDVEIVFELLLLDEMESIAGGAI